MPWASGMQIFQGVPKQRHGPLSAEYDPDWRVFPFVHPVFRRVVKIEMHLSRVSVRELFKFQVYDNEGSGFAMKEEEVNTIPFIADPQTVLSSDKCKIAAEFQQKRFELLHEGFG